MRVASLGFMNIIAGVYDISLSKIYFVQNLSIELCGRSCK